jgi:hypothetical protein
MKVKRPTGKRRSSRLRNGSETVLYNIVCQIKEATMWLWRILLRFFADLVGPNICIRIPSDGASGLGTSFTAYGVVNPGSNSVTVKVVAPPAPALTFGPVVAASGDWSIAISGLAAGKTYQMTAANSPKTMSHTVGFTT